MCSQGANIEYAGMRTWQLDPKTPLVHAAKDKSEASEGILNVY